MADSVKPFSCEETRTILQHLQQPAVFVSMARGWPVLHWTAEHLSGRFGDKRLRFRLGRKEEITTPLFETQCSYVEAKLSQFLNWTLDQSGTDIGPFVEYPYSDYWAYADYKYIAVLFQDQPSMFEDVRWSEFGFEGRNGRDSTLWIGTEGANTPCHLDTYGCNLVLQVQGRKRWHLFSPEDTANLYPTRVPYEESSVFSQVNPVHPDLRSFPAFQRARAHIVTLQPGQVLYVPRHWWHYVESVDPVTVSVNSWIELEVDDVARVSEAVTKAVVCAIKGAQSDDNSDNWLNPTEEGAMSHNENMQYVNLAVRACGQRHMNLCHSKLSQDSRETRPVKRDSRGQVRKHNDPMKDSAPFCVPFGPHLIPVCCQQEDLPGARRGGAPKNLEVESSINCAARFAEDCSDAALRTQPTSAVVLHHGKHDCGPGFSQSGESGCADGTLEESRHATITTNDLLDCLVHPDVISRVTELLLERHTGRHRNTTAL
ncbi:hypothetical protein Q5P01_013851 [Channa striata]|uniref:JmjC domain-containing protein n=1 Tax=Channa striata TaxID=64152 RepID=A0AA88ML87_CHASR|nr:hypothetical protein Q5P01_013851 [Channa striata]